MSEQRSEQQWTPEKILRYFSIVNPPIRAHVKRLAQHINVALAAAVESAVVHPAELITKMVKLEKELAAERQLRLQETDDANRLTCKNTELRQQLLSALAAIEKYNSYYKHWSQHELNGTLHPTVITVDHSALDEHDAEVRKPLVDALRDTQAKLPYAPYAAAKVCRDALAKVKEGK